MVKVFYMVLLVVVSFGFLLIVHTHDDQIQIAKSMNNDLTREYFLKSDGLNHSEKLKLADTLCRSARHEFTSRAWISGIYTAEDPGSCVTELLQR